MDCYAAFAEIAQDFKEIIRAREFGLRRLQDDLAEGLAKEADAVRQLEHQVATLKLRLARADEPATVCAECARPLVHDQYAREVAEWVGERGRSVWRRRPPSPPDAGGASRRRRSPSRGSLRRDGGNALRSNDLARGFADGKDEPLQSADFAQQWDSMDRVDFGQQWSPYMFDYPPDPAPLAQTADRSTFATTRYASPQRRFYSPIRRHSPQTLRRPATPPTFPDPLQMNGGQRRRRPDASDDEDIEARMRQLSAKIESVSSKTFRMLDRTSHLSHTSEALRDQIVGLHRDLKDMTTSYR